MIDVKTYNRMHSADIRDPIDRFGCSISDGPKFDSWPIKVAASKKLTDEAAMLLPKTIRGFELEGKKWSMWIWSSASPHR